MNRFQFAAPLLRTLDPETAHDLTLWALKHGLGPRSTGPAAPALGQTLWSRHFANPLGLAAGFDKNAAVVGPMLAMGFGFVEIGSVTPKPQPGNPRPRVFRLAEDGAVINRMGFPGLGQAVAATNLARWRETGTAGLVGANLGKNKDSADAAADYGAAAGALAAFADYLVVNVSSPNTPGLRALQSRAALESLIAAVRTARDQVSRHAPPILVKIAPDLAPEDRDEIAGLALGGGVDGLIVGNTTIQRPEFLRSPRRGEAGGLSGQPLFALSTEVLRDMYRRTEGRVPLIGVGGIGSAAQAYAKIRAGASLVQLYTALVYRGPTLIGEILAGLAAHLKADGFATLSGAIGADHR